MQFCKDRKIKGITGKSKDKLIAMLNNSESHTVSEIIITEQPSLTIIEPVNSTPFPKANVAEPVLDINSIAAFIEKHIVHEDGDEASFKDIVRKYKEWCITRPEHVLLKKSELMAALSLVLGDLANDKYKGVKLI